MSTTQDSEFEIPQELALPDSGQKRALKINHYPGEPHMWLIIIVLGLCSVLYGFWNLQSVSFYQNLQTNGVSAPAKIILKRYQRTNRVSYYYIEYLTEYKDKKIKGSFVLSNSFNMVRPKVGNTIAVRFLPENPDRNYAISNPDLNQLPAAINWEILCLFGYSIFFGVACLACAYFMLLQLLRQKKVLERGVATVGYVQSVGAPPSYTNVYKERKAKGPYRVEYRFITSKEAKGGAAAVTASMRVPTSLTQGLTEGDVVVVVYDLNNPKLSTIYGAGHYIVSG